jgi:hypothetical protein
VDWPPRFRPAPGRFNGSSDPVEFLQQYAIAIRVAGGDGRVMAHWFPVATKEEPRWWLLELPLGSILSWRDLCERFLDKYTPWCQSPRAHRSPLLSAASSPEREELKLGAWGFCLPVFS